jgi:hypothetical protein
LHQRVAGSCQAPCCQQWCAAQLCRCCPVAHNIATRSEQDCTPYTHHLPCVEIGKC